MKLLDRKEYVNECTKLIINEFEPRLKKSDIHTSEIGNIFPVIDCLLLVQFKIAGIFSHAQLRKAFDDMITEYKEKHPLRVLRTN